MAVKKRILVVDDDKDFIETMKLALEAAGHEVLSANDGEAGLEMAAQENPDLMLLDLNMPKKDGFGVLKQVRGQGDSIRVIIVTGDSDEKHEQYAEVLGANGFFRKPMAMEVLLKIIEKHLK